MSFMAIDFFGNRAQAATLVETAHSSTAATPPPRIQVVDKFKSLAFAYDKKGCSLIGECALEQHKEDPKNVITDALDDHFRHRFIGADPKQSFGCFADIDHATRMYTISGIEFLWKNKVSAVEVIAAFLAELKASVRQRTGIRVNRAAIVVPSYASDIYRRIIEQAATIVGFDELILVNRTTAVATHYNVLHLDKKANKHTVAVLVSDTRSVELSVFRDTPSDVLQQLKVVGYEDAEELLGTLLPRRLVLQSTEGCADFGQLDFAEALMNHCLSLIVDDYGERELSRMNALEACQAFNLASWSNSFRITFRYYDVHGKAKMFRQDFTRDELEQQILAVQFVKLTTMMKSALDKHKGTIDRLILVGPVWRTRFMQRELAQYLASDCFDAKGHVSELEAAVQGAMWISVREWGKSIAVDGKNGWTPSIVSESVYRRLEVRIRSSNEQLADEGSTIELFDHVRAFSDALEDVVSPRNEMFSLFIHNNRAVEFEIIDGGLTLTRISGRSIDGFTKTRFYISKNAIVVAVLFSSDDGRNEAVEYLQPKFNAMSDEDVSRFMERFEREDRRAFYVATKFIQNQINEERDRLKMEEREKREQQKQMERERNKSQKQETTRQKSFDQNFVCPPGFGPNATEHVQGFCSSQDSNIDVNHRQYDTLLKRFSEIHNILVKENKELKKLYCLEVDMDELKASYNEVACCNTQIYREQFIAIAECINTKIEALRRTYELTDLVCKNRGGIFTRDIYLFPKQFNAVLLYEDTTKDLCDNSKASCKSTVVNIYKNFVEIVREKKRPYSSYRMDYAADTRYNELTEYSFPDRFRQNLNVGGL